MEGLQYRANGQLKIRPCHEWRNVRAKFDSEFGERGMNEWNQAGSHTELWTK